MGGKINVGHRPKTRDGTIHQTSIDDVATAVRPIFPRSPPHGFCPGPPIRSDGRPGKRKRISQGSLLRSDGYYQRKKERRFV